MLPVPRSCSPTSSLVVRTRFGLKALVLAGDRDGVSKWAVALSDSEVLVGDCDAGSTRNGVGIPLARAHLGHGLATDAHPVGMRKRV